MRLALRRMVRARGVRQEQAATLGWDRLRRVLDGLGESPADLRDAGGSGIALIRRSKTDPAGALLVAFVSSDTLRRARAAGIAVEAIGGHSTRVGVAQDRVAHNLGLSAIQQAGGWSSLRMPARFASSRSP